MLSKAGRAHGMARTGEGPLEMRERSARLATITRPWPLAALLGLGGCDAGAPSLTLVGSYFPAWILCSLIGVAVGVGVRLLLTTTRLAETAAFPLVICLASGVIAGVLAWLIFYRA